MGRSLKVLVLLAALAVGGVGAAFAPQAVCACAAGAEGCGSDLADDGCAALSSSCSAARCLRGDLGTDAYIPAGQILMAQSWPTQPGARAVPAAAIDPALRPPNAQAAS